MMMNDIRFERKECVSCKGDGHVNGIKEGTWRNIPVPLTDHENNVICNLCKGEKYTCHIVLDNEELCQCFEGTMNATAQIYNNRCREFFGHPPIPLTKNCPYCNKTGRINKPLNI